MHTARTPLLRYWPLGKLGFLMMLTYRWECLFTSVSSILTVLVSYYLWSAIFAGASAVDPRFSFASTFAYVGVSAAILATFNTSAESVISRQIISGDIIRSIVRPIDFHFSQASVAMGNVALRSFFGLIPCMTLVILLLPPGWIDARNVFLFAVSLIGSFTILLHLDMLTGLVAVRTEAVWGIRLAKEYVVLICSGALIPIDWMPPSIAPIMLVLPFQGICHAPVKLLTTQGLSAQEAASLLGMQLLWATALVIGVRAAFRHLISKIEVHGG
jgi:ABC-2 type transport system permease protein